jgi:hypothetical protein
LYDTDINNSLTILFSGFYYIINLSLYLYSYSKEYHSKKDDKIYTYWYKCSQDRSLAKRPRKHEDKEKHRDKIPIERFDCESTIKIIINTDNQQATINYTHGILHKRPERYLINEEIKEFINSQMHLSPAEIFGQLELNNPNITQKQVHYWWTQIMKKNYEKNQNQLISTHLLLSEKNYNIILMDLNGDVKYIGFITPLFQKLVNNKEILVDATCKYSLKLAFYI